MSLLYKIKRRVSGSVVDLAGRLGVDIQKVQGLDVQIRKLRSIKDSETRLHATEELVRKYPRHPKPHLELMVYYHNLGDTRQFEQMNQYGEVRREWLEETGLARLDMEFIWVGIVIGSLGNHYAIESLLKANQYGLRPARKPFLLLPENAQLRNPGSLRIF